MRAEHRRRPSFGTLDNRSFPVLGPLGIQIAGSYNKNGALQAYLRARGAYASILGGIKPMIARGFSATATTALTIASRTPAATRAAADALCAKMLQAGGTCVVLRNETRPPPAYA